MSIKNEFKSAVHTYMINNTKLSDVLENSDQKIFEAFESRELSVNDFISILSDTRALFNIENDVDNIVNSGQWNQMEFDFDKENYDK